MIRYLIDTSAYVHLVTHPDDMVGWDAEIETGAIGISEATRTEILFSANGPADRDDIESDLSALFGLVRIPKDAWRWVENAQYKLTQKGRHRAAGPLDLLVCATAVHHGLTVLHRDNDFATVARVIKEVHQRDVRRIEED
ncbi:PIN domain-containing protein [Streptomyces xanthophaeus]|uniref:Ribonuclease VapC n=1 Tax=Streptomyces xanthophaeus TaxID=67385 RepID=A0A919HBA9_9ACTN|nr:PIN domain nuclease [Streptomyces xanthophaeus]GHI89948.1 ribonuclease VapC [Streptomyces xanthophaeus]